MNKEGLYLDQEKKQVVWTCLLYTSIQVLLLETDYEKIVFDIGFITDAMMVLLEKADRIFMPEARHPIQKSKQQAFERLILREHLEQIWNKTDKVPVLHRENISEKR